MAFDGKRLINHLIRTIESVHEDFCGSLCFMEHSCVSYNIKTTSGSPIAAKCELNNSTHKDYPQDLKSEDNYIYRGTEVIQPSILNTGVFTIRPKLTEISLQIKRKSYFPGSSKF